MIGSPLADGPSDQRTPAASRLEVELRLEALRARVPSRRDDDTPGRTVEHSQRDTHETEAATMARLRALAARLDSMGDRP